jgi:hypothetical protein
VGWTCSVCGEDHAGIPFDWACAEPTYWTGPQSEDDFLEDDLCSWVDDGGTRCYFIRGILALPVADADETLAYGVWSSLSEESFKRVLELWEDPARTDEPPYFGLLSNALPGYPNTLGLPLDVLTRELELRPSFVLHPGDHPLIVEQEHGITLARVHEIAEQNTHRT